MKARCYNCKHKSNSFKVGKLTHYHCFHPKYEEEGKKGNVSPWETLVVFSETCDDHEFKPQREEPVDGAFLLFRTKNV